MRILMGMFLACLPLMISVGCGESRPDPRANPDFDEEAYNDPNIMPGVEEGESLLPPPGLRVPVRL
ncbi:hypothetical protein [Candidatus Laterigemmans baculatus]|uniref:hypothetical protein n=1 Tax=Candidatus Laterigemmans baculatus TaxID=2770505 RepID=UPI0013DBA42E|nr:hypothetical protein [Candidatus Laterigemmans baculatus]